MIPFAGWYKMFHGVSSFWRRQTAFLNVLQSGAYANSPIFHQPCDTTKIQNDIVTLPLFQNFCVKFQLIASGCTLFTESTTISRPV
ncbi:MAG TPA: hypothetical protein QF556_05790, partial [Rhodospirillales bacterium]|nr:hypothetical protein [Rhodospirillales bacterium]